MKRLSKVLFLATAMALPLGLLANNSTMFESTKSKELKISSSSEYWAFGRKIKVEGTYKGATFKMRGSREEVLSKLKEMKDS